MYIEITATQYTNIGMILKSFWLITLRTFCANIFIYVWLYAVQYYKRACFNSLLFVFVFGVSLCGGRIWNSHFQCGFVWPYSNRMDQKQYIQSLKVYGYYLWILWRFLTKIITTIKNKKDILKTINQVYSRFVIQLKNFLT